MNLKRYNEHAGLGIESRDVGEGVSAPVLRGHASVFDSWTTLYEGRTLSYREVVRKGAFAKAISESQDVRLLFNHDSNFVLARTKSGTLLLREDPQGLYSEAELLNSQTIRDLVIEPAKRGDITGMSFAFSVRPEGETIKEYEKDGRTIVERELTDLNLYDVSIVTYPAYESSSADIRSLTAEMARRESKLITDRRLIQMDMRLRLAEAL